MDTLAIPPNAVGAFVNRKLRSFAKRAGIVARTEDGFNLLDLLVYIGIVAILAGAILPSLIHARNAAFSSRAENDISNVNLIIGLYFNDYGYYPGAASGAVSAYEITAANLGANYPAPPTDPLTHTAYTLTVTTTSGVTSYEIDAPGVYDASTLTNINNGVATTKTGISFTSSSGFAPK